MESCQILEQKPGRKWKEIILQGLLHLAISIIRMIKVS